MIKVNSSAFYRAVAQVDESVRDLMELTREKELPEVDNGVRRYYADIGKCAFQVSGQFDRPDEYLQALLDMIRVQYQYYPLTTFGLNSNLMAYLLSVISNKEIEKGYFSIIGGDKQSFTDFWQTEVLVYAEKCGYLLSDAKAMFVVVTAGVGSYSLPLLTEVNDVLDSGMSVKEAVKCMVSDIAGEEVSVPEVCAGFCEDEAMLGRLRVSVWLIFD